MTQQPHSLNEIDIAGYLDGTLSTRKRRALERALASDPDLCERMGIIGDVLSAGDHLPSAGDAPAHLIERTVRVYEAKISPVDIILSLAGEALRIVRMSRSVLLSQLPPAPAFRRAGAETPSLAVIKKEFDDISVRVIVERIAKNRCNFHLTAAGRNTTPVPRLRADLISAGREIASSQFEGGQVLFEDVRPGRYDIIVREGVSVRGRLSIKLQG